MWGLISRICCGQAPSPAEQLHRLRLDKLEHDVLRAIAARRADRLARPPRSERKRFERARPKVDELRRALSARATRA
ncbi:MAG: hypothetical protein DI530_15055 [Sphingomonas sp.]|uniref:hypothetical protein n=1 Tax=Sphingomonas sp. TaxID=28214 RepID=UPI000DBC1C88|nr:hypothetical protein [Sphingomonas sp.]PZU75570.1 MAG: hypothetical protein DI530_15055 [Sphingomonas sp.]